MAIRVVQQINSLKYEKLTQITDFQQIKHQKYFV